MTKVELLVDGFHRVRDAFHPAVNGLSRDELAFRPDDESNSIAWLAWHLARVQDETVAALSGGREVWTGRGWFDRLGLPLDPADTGYGHDARQVATVVADARSLVDYFEDVHERTVGWLADMDEADLDRVVEPRWDPPITAAHRLVGTLADDLAHVGQAAYVRGILMRRTAAG